MPTFTGHLAASAAAVSASEGNPALAGYISAALAGMPAGISEPATGALTLRVTPTRRRGVVTLTAATAPAAAGDLWFNRLHLVPQSAAAGNVITAQTFFAELYSAFDAERIHATDTITGGDGITQSVLGRYTTQGFEAAAGLSTLPQTYKAGESRKYQYVVTPGGPVTIDARFIHNVSASSIYSAATPDFTITGTRSTVLAFMANWKGGIDETLSWFGSVTASRNEKEQRRQLIYNPRRMLSYDILGLSIQQAGLFQSIMFGLQTRRMTVPLWRDSQWLGQTLAAGSISIPVQTADRDFVAGGLVMLYDDFQNFEVGTIAAGGVAAGTVTLVSVTARSWTNRTQVVPCRMGRLAQRQVINEHSRRVVTAPLAIELDPSTVPPLPTGYTYPYTYRGLPVFAEDRAIDGPQQAEHQRNSETLDDGFTSIEIVENATFPVHTRLFTFIKQGRPAITEFMKFLGDRKGTLKPFWMPTKQADIEPVGSIGSGDTDIIIKEIGYANYAPLRPGRLDIAFIRAQTGVITMRRITAAESNGDGTETITIDSALGYAAAPADHAAVSWLVFCRLEGDSVALKWHTDRVITAQLTLRAMRSPD